MLWIKAFHIILMVTWFAGLFYLPRLFVYHAQAVDPIGQDRFKTMERKLLVIMTIGAVGTVLTGLWLLLGWWASALPQAITPRCAWPTSSCRSRRLARPFRPDPAQY